MQKTATLVITSLIASICNAQTNEKGSFYLGWGYNKDWYSKSDIRFQNNNPQLINGKYYIYDFTVNDLTAKDKPDFDQIKDVVNITKIQLHKAKDMSKLNVSFGLSRRF